MGWRGEFACQAAALDGEPARVTAVHRGAADVIGEFGSSRVPLTGKAAELDIAVGDWLLRDHETGRVIHRLERFGAFVRKAPGTDRSLQTIAANVDTVFLVTSSNAEFSVARLERYLTLAREAKAFPVVVITKADLEADIARYEQGARDLAAGLIVESLDARDPAQVSALSAWCSEGQTLALLGSSGVGKSTLLNSLSGAQQAVGAVREDDKKGRHTTTSRSMHPLQAGGWVIDTPGMRELQLVDVAQSIDDVFDDVSELADSCRFSDCSHDQEPGCAVAAAIELGDIDADRLRRYHKLLAEDRRNSQTLAERRAHDRSLGQLYRSVQSSKRQMRRD